MGDEERPVKPGQDVSGDDAPFLDDEDEAILDAIWDEIAEEDEEAERKANEAPDQ